MTLPVAGGAVPRDDVELGASAIGAVRARAGKRATTAARRSRPGVEASTLCRLNGAAGSCNVDRKIERACRDGTRSRTALVHGMARNRSGRRSRRRRGRDGRARAPARTWTPSTAPLLDEHCSKRRRVNGPFSRNLIDQLTSLGLAYQEHDRHELALAMFDRALFVQAFQRRALQPRSGGARRTAHRQRACDRPGQRPPRSFRTDWSSSRGAIAPIRGPRRFSATRPSGSSTITSAICSGDLPAFSRSTARVRSDARLPASGRLAGTTTRPSWRSSRNVAGASGRARGARGRAHAHLLSRSEHAAPLVPRPRRLCCTALGLVSYLRRVEYTRVAIAVAPSTMRGRSSSSRTGRCSSRATARP